MQPILINDLLQISDEDIRKTRLKLNVFNGSVEPLEEYKKDPNKINVEWFLWHNKRRYFKEGQIAICLLYLYSDKWLLTTIKKITKELAAVGILDDEKVTSDWNELETAIIERLRDEDNDIPYLLLMLDEADCLIESSKEVNFLPIVKLKNIQQISNGRFKFVLAGLHDLVRFNRSVALGRNSVIAHLSYINIKPFIYEDAEKLLLTPLSYLGFSFENDSVLISQILASTNYFPGLIQLYCKKLIETMKVGYAGYNENTTPPYIVTESHIKKVLSDKHFRDEIKNKFEITLRLDDAYYIIALIMASLDDSSENKNGYSSSDILAEAQKLKINLISELDKEQIDAFLGELVDLNVLKSTGGGLFSFSTKNFRDMLGSKNDIEEKLLSLMC